MKQRLILVFVLFVYCLILVKVMVFKDVPPIRIGSLILNFGGSQEGWANFLPFKTIFSYLTSDKGIIIAGINLFGNVILLVPIGFLVSLINRNLTWKNSLVLAIASGLVIEGTQVLLRLGIFDIDDVILNGLGVMGGYWVYKFFQK
jgi:glycopeptide antibiotics resistance protein